MTSPHAPVLLAEVIEALAPKAGDVVIDATFGAGGYTRAILERGADVVALDRDPTVQPFAEAVTRDFPDRFQLIRTPFSGLAEAFEESGKAKLDGAVFDIGVSSMQLDQAERGFSFMRDGPLDMRMSDEGATAADIVNTWDHGPLAHIFKLYGDERQSGRVATAKNPRLWRRLLECTATTGDDGVVAPVQVIAALGRGQGKVVPPDCQPGDLGKQDRLAVTPGSPKRTGRRSALRRDRDGRHVQAIGIAAPKMQDRTRETLVLNHMLRLVLSAPRGF